MSLKCSIFGHRFGEPVVERERDESGSEVVITIQEIQTCTRCGTERVVSENKEVTTLETPDDEPAPEPDPDPEVPDAADDLAAVGPGDADAPDAGSDASYDPEQDDAEIVEESPETSIVEEAEPDAPSPTDEPTEETSAPDDDAVILEDEPDEDQDDEREPGAWPEEPEDEGSDWEPPTNLADTPIGELDDTGPDVEPAGEAVTVPQGTFHCPECGFSTPVESSSLRAGDFCPDCHTGSLVHEPDEE